MGVTWVDGRLAAKQLFDALNAVGIPPNQRSFTNLFEHRGLAVTRHHLRAGSKIVAMGKKVQRELTRRGIPHIPIVHPAARGTIRLKSNYAAHVAAALT
jgi:hypothetical protein